MSRFNLKFKKKFVTTNLAGGQAYTVSPKLALASQALTSFVEDQYYRSSTESLASLVDLIYKVDDPLFVAKVAVFARNEFGMRTVSHVLAGEVAFLVRGKGQEWAKRFFNLVVRRPDDMSEIMSYYLRKYRRPIPNALKKGLAQAFDKFDSYQLAKYRGEKHQVSLVDVVNLVRPKPNERNGQALKALVVGKLRSASTWESMMTRVGQQSSTEEEKRALKAVTWRELIRTGRLGYFALLRNLRNIYEQAPEVLNDALTMLVNKELISSSLVLPFRFHTAYKKLEECLTDRGILNEIKSAISVAASISMSNVPTFPGESLVALDCSGSMSGKPFDIGSMFAVALTHSSNADLLIFSEDAKHLKLDPEEDIFRSINFIRKHAKWDGTDFRCIFRALNKAYDRIFVLSDMQAWIGNDLKREFKKYCTRFQCEPKMFSFDLQGYGTLQFPEENVYALAGWSEKLFDIMKLLDQGRDALIKRIEEVVI